MKKIALNILDEYAKCLTEKQIGMLCEHKLGKQYTKSLYEFDENDKNIYRLYLNEFLIAEEADMNKTEFLMFLTENNKELMHKISYKLDEDAINFSAKSRQDYASLLFAIKDAGIENDTLKSQLDEKYQ